MKPKALLSALVLILPLNPLLGFAKQDKTLLSNIQSLTLRNNRKTSHRRVEAISQLKCVGGNAKGLYEVDVLRCKNQGSDYDDENIQWTCSASLPPEFKLGTTDVICEGYSSPTDPYVLKGSCGVEYTLVLTPQGEDRYRLRKEASDRKSAAPEESSEGSTTAAILFSIVFVSVLLFICFKAWQNYSGSGRASTGGRRGGGGPGDDDDPPPPYDYGSRPSFNSPKKSYGSARSGTESWRPGFLSGAAAGAAAGYGAANWQNQRNARDSHAGGFSGNGEGSSRSSQEGGSSGPSHSSARYESSGFGSTKRR